MAPELSLQYSLPNGFHIPISNVDEWELVATHKALRNLRVLLSSEQMQTLLKMQIEEADAYFNDLIKSSNGEFKESRIDLKAGGLTMGQSMDWHKEWNTQLNYKRYHMLLPRYNSSSASRALCSSSIPLRYY